MSESIYCCSQMYQLVLTAIIKSICYQIEDMCDTCLINAFAMLSFKIYINFVFNFKLLIDCVISQTEQQCTIKLG